MTAPFSNDNSMDSLESSVGPERLNWDCVHEQLLPQIEHLAKNKLQGLFGGGYLVENGLREEDWSVVSKGWQIVSQNQFETGRCIAHLSTLCRAIEELCEPCNLAELLCYVSDEVESQKDYLNVAGFRLDVPVGHRCQIEPLSSRSAIIGLVRICAGRDTNAAPTSIELTVVAVRSDKSGVRISCRGVDPSAESILAMDALEDRLTNEALLVEWKVANYALVRNGCKLSVLQDAKGGVAFVIELPDVVA
jgi:hypothetical protein